MPALDFTEIAVAHEGQHRDQFELFARELLEHEGFVIVSGPDRGADDGRDLIVEEIRKGPGGETRIRWLVSCKHKAHSGASVMPKDELNIRDRIETHGCVGFIPFYSTIPSSGLGTILEELRRKFDYSRYDPEIIERKLLDTPAGREIAARFMPKSYQKWAALVQFQPTASQPIVTAATASLHPHDLHLAASIKQLISPVIRKFLEIQDFGAPFHRDNLSPLETIHEWRGIDYEFADDVLQGQFQILRERLASLMKLTGKYLFTNYANTNFMTAKTHEDEENGYTPATRANISTMNEAANDLVAAIDDFRRTMRDRLKM